MKTVDVANCCLREVAKHAGDSHQYSFNIKHLNSSTQLFSINQKLLRAEKELFAHVIET